MHGMVVDPGESFYQEQYVIHPNKNGVLLCNNGVRTTSNLMDFNMGEKTIKCERQFIQRHKAKR